MNGIKSIMIKDLMTNGAATWITYANPDKITLKNNPWKNAGEREPQFAPIEDKGGVALFLKSFTVSGVEAASIDATALGVFDIYVNGNRVGRKNERGETVYDEMKPGWTDYNKRVLYYSYDLAPYLKDGENTLLIAVAPGWWNGDIAWETYGKTRVSVLAAIHITGKSGKKTYYTDKSWQSAWGSSIRAADIWHGELYDANEPTFSDLSSGKGVADWSEVVPEQHDIFVTKHIGPTVMIRSGLTRTPKSIVVYDGIEDNGSDFGKIRVVRTLKDTGNFRLTKGETAVIDLGQNMVGLPTFTVKGASGTWIQLRVGEMLNDSGLKSRGNDNPEGSVYTVNYRTAKAKAYYILNGNESGEYYRPTFTFFGFRYLEISATEDIEISDLTCYVLGSEIKETGSMQTSHKKVNQLISNIIWGQRGNYLSVPTDCPQRNERLGWTGDTQAFCGTASYNADVREFFHKWLQDMRDSQNEDGVYSDVAPASSIIGIGGAAWSDAGIIVPYIMWKMYDDTDIIYEHYDSMEKFMSWLDCPDMNAHNSFYGDWLAYEPTDKDLICVAYYALDCMYMQTMSHVIGKSDRAEHYKATYNRVREHFKELYCDENGELKPENRTQCAYLLVLRMGLIDEDKCKKAIAELKKKIVDNGYKLSTGFVGTCILCEILAEFGENNLAYSLLLQTENPSWLYSVDQGATTIWERWNSYTKADGFGDVSMNSFNHYAYGAIQEWMYRHVAGIETTPDAPGFAHPILQPKPDTRTDEEIPCGQERIRWTKTSFESKQGLIVSNWDTQNGFKYECTVPVPSTLYLPILTSADTYTINGKEHRFADGNLTENGDALVIELPAGSYTFIQK